MAAPLWWLGPWGIALGIALLLLLVASFWLWRFYRRRVVGLILLALLFAGAAGTVSAADLSLTSARTGYQVGETFNLNVIVQSPGQAINAVSGSVAFPPGRLRVVSVAKNNSIVSLWPAEPSFDNNTGVIHFEGVILNPGFAGAAGPIVTVQFKASAAGPALVSLTDGAVLANDGQGTNVLNRLGQRTISLSATEPVVPTLNENLPPAPALVSPTHPRQDIAYPTPAAEFTWPVPADVTAVRLLYDKYPSTTPGVTYNERLDHKTLPVLDDGTWYFHAQFENEGGRGAISHYRFIIDRAATTTVEAVAPTATSSATTTPVIILIPPATTSEPLVVLQGESRFDILEQIIAYYFTDPAFLLKLIGVLLLVIIILLIGFWRYSYHRRAAKL